MDLNSNSVLLNLLRSLQSFPRRKACWPCSSAAEHGLAGHMALGSISKTGKKKEERESR